MADELAALRQRLAGITEGAIGIDGINGVGKSRRVAARLGLPVIAIDDYLRGDGRFLDGIDYGRLQAALADMPRPYVIEGCCLLAVLERVRFSIDLHVYVRRMSANGFWHDADVAEGELLEQVLATNRAIARAVRAGRNNLDHDLALYHHRFRPYQNADIVLDLVEQSAACSPALVLPKIPSKTSNLL